MTLKYIMTVELVLHNNKCNFCMIKTCVAFNATKILQN